MSSKIIYLNGPSSCGKSTLAKALQETFEQPYLHVGIDKLIGFMPSKVNDFYGTTEKEGYFWKPAVDPKGNSTYQIHAGPFGKKIDQTYKDVVCLLAAQNYNLIIDDVAFGVLGVEEWKSALKDQQVLYVGVTAPVDVLEERERARGDRLIGSARGQYYSVHENVEYDLEVDTQALSTEEIVEKIILTYNDRFQ